MAKKGQIPARMPEREELRDNPVKLCNDIAHLFRATLRQMSETEDTMAQRGTRLVLSFLAIGDGVTQLDLVKATHLKAPTVSVILKKLEDDGFVERKKDKEDLRALRVYLTENGRELDRRNIDKIKHADAQALEGLNDEECEMITRLLSKIRDNLINIQECRGEKK